MACRQKISDKQKDVLLKKFNDEGMQTCGQATISVRQAAAAETGLSIATVNVRIFWLQCTHVLRLSCNI